MGDLDVSGGAGGMAARLSDLRTQSRVMREAGGDLLERVGPVSGVAVDDDVLAAVLVCPDVVPGVEAAVTAAAVGPHGLAVRGAALGVSGTVIEASVTTYEVVDAAAATSLDALQFAGGFAVGALLPGVVLAGGLVVATNPLLLAGLVAYGTTGDPLEDLSQTLYDNPWMLEALTRGSPALVQGLSFSLAGLLGPQGSPLLTALTGGHWPSADYEDSVAGLIALMNLGGQFEDTGDFTVADDPSSTTEVRWGDTTAIEDVFDQQSRMDAGLTEAESQASGQLRVIEVPQPDGSTAYVVQIPGTEDWATSRGDNPVDLTTNVHLMTQEDTVWRQTVIDAIRDKVPPGAPVMLTGHSQGGITAASIASDPAVVSELNIRSVVTGGSPIGRFDIDDRVSVLSVEHQQDPVPMLDGAGNPDRPNWTTVRRDLPDALAQDGNGVANPGLAHASGNYATTGAMIDASSDPSVQEWLRQNEEFFSDSGTATASRYDIDRK